MGHWKCSSSFWKLWRFFSGSNLKSRGGSSEFGPSSCVKMWQDGNRLHTWRFQRRSNCPLGLHWFFGTSQPIVLSQIIHGSPAETFGVRQGDIVLSVGGVDVSAATAESVSRSLVGTIGSTVDIVVRRKGETTALPPIPRGVLFSLLQLRESQLLGQVLSRILDGRK